MSGLTTAAIIGLIAAEGAKAGTDIYAAHKASQTATDAAALQTKFGQQGLNALQQNYQQARQDFEPYRQAGSQAASTLGALLNPNAPYHPGSVPTAPAPQGMLQPQMGTGGPMPPRPGMGRPPSGGATMANLGTIGNGDPSMVTVRGPDGSTTQMPRIQAQQFAGRPGFQVMG